MDKSTARRSPNWDQDEKDLLAKLVSEKLDIIENIKLDTNTNKIKKDAWNTVHTIFNLSTTTERSLEQIQNQWRKMKHAAKLKRADDCPTSEPQEEDSLSRLRTHFEHGFKTHDSSLSISELNITTIKHELDELLTGGDDGENVYYDDRYKNEELAPAKRLNLDEDVESSKRIKLLELSILQKECEIKYAKTEFEKKIKVIELQMQQMNEEHSFKMEKIKRELAILKNN